MGKWIFLIFLVWAVWQDLRSRTVGQGFLAAAGSLGAAVSLLSGRSRQDIREYLERGK